MGGGLACFRGLEASMKKLRLTKDPKSEKDRSLSAVCSRGNPDGLPGSGNIEGVLWATCGRLPWPRDGMCMPYPGAIQVSSVVPGKALRAPCHLTVAHP